MTNIKDHIFPETKGNEGDCKFVLNAETVSNWVERLKVCTESWGVFILLLYGKYIDRYGSITQTPLREVSLLGSADKTPRKL